MSAYEWFLLPETESFDQTYRQKWGIQTAKKIRLNMDNTAIYDIDIDPIEVVVGGSGFSRADYRAMMEIYMCYYFLVQGGVYTNTIKQILKKNNIEFSEFLKKFYYECYLILKTQSHSFNYYDEYLTNYTNEETTNLYNDIYWNNDPTIKVTHRYYLIMEYFKNFEKLAPTVETWLIAQGANPTIVTKESGLIISEHRLTRPKTQLFTTIKYNHKIMSDQDLIAYDKLSYDRIIV